MKDEPVITESEWMADLDNIRNMECSILTEDEYQFVKYARENEHPVPWVKLLECFNSIFPKHRTKRNTIMDRYQRSKNHYEKT